MNFKTYFTAFTVGETAGVVNADQNRFKLLHVPFAQITLFKRTFQMSAPPSTEDGHDFQTHISVEVVFDTFEYLQTDYCHEIILSKLTL